MAAAMPEYDTCLCCNDKEILQKDAVCCPAGHVFCMLCVRETVETQIDKKVTTFPCLTACECEFGHDTLEWVLEPSVFARLAQLKQKKEVRPGFEECPFCDYGRIPYELSSLFRCLNPACMKISCRLCKKINHRPLFCYEMRKFKEGKVQTYLEVKMPEALLSVPTGPGKDAAHTTHDTRSKLTAMTNVLRWPSWCVETEQPSTSKTPTSAEEAVSSKRKLTDNEGNLPKRTKENVAPASDTMHAFVEARETPNTVLGEIKSAMSSMAEANAKQAAAMTSVAESAAVSAAAVASIAAALTSLTEVLIAEVVAQRSFTK